ncbi:MAG: hypothetical protein J0G30_12825 [Actinomycetales bacterium]|nr:hypothetical protein [Actinomycetales bacterium]
MSAFEVNAGASGVGEGPALLVHCLELCQHGEMMSRTLIAMLLAAAALLVSCSAPAPSLTSASPPTSDSPSPTQTPRADGSRLAPYPLGEFVHVADASIWDFTIHSPSLDANSEVAAADEFNDPPTEDTAWVAANISGRVRDIPELADASSEPTALPASLNPLFVGGDGVVYDFWTIGYPAFFNGESWNSQPDLFVSAALENWTVAALEK